MAITLPKIITKRKRVGRGTAGGGAKSGRGMKGQHSRAGYSSKAGFECGQTPLYMRLPKGRGTKQKSRSQVQKPASITLLQLKNVAVGSIVGPGLLRKMGLITSRDTVKVIGNEKLENKLTVRAHKFSAGAKKAIEDAGGKVEVIVAK